MLEKSTYETYIRILEEELVPALGCTEPIAIALASAKAREALGVMPEEYHQECQGRYRPDHRQHEGHQYQRHSGCCGWRPQPRT